MALPRKSTRATARRRRPSSSTPEDILADHTPAVVRLAQRLRTLVKEAVPDAREVAYPGWHGIGYRHPRAGYFCGLFPLADRVRLGFEFGVLLHDPSHLLTGSGTKVRYLEVRTKHRLPAVAVRRLLEEAIRLKSS